MIESKKGFFTAAILLMFTGLGCFPTYETQTATYIKKFSAADSIPDYSNLTYWAAHPWVKDPSDSIPKPLRQHQIDTSVDVFFIHPTTLTDEKLAGTTWNASLSDGALNAKTDYTSILYQASVFNASCRVFAPRYRQAHIYSFYAKDTVRAQAALAFAYADVEAAFSYYLEHYNQGRPIIIASHSQGTLHAALLLKKFFDHTPLQKKLVAAYIIGLPVDQHAFQYLEPCRTPDAVGCINSWRTFQTGFIPDYVKEEKTESIVVNPLSWTTIDSSISRKKNNGSVLYNFNKRYRHTNGAKIEDHILWTNRPKFLFGFLLKTKNYHAGDYNLFYYSIKDNIRVRIAAYFSKS